LLLEPAVPISWILGITSMPNRRIDFIVSSIVKHAPPNEISITPEPKIPAAIPGIVFLSGGMRQATLILNGFADHKWRASTTNAAPPKSRSC
jgi:hypothetical protein